MSRKPRRRGAAGSPAVIAALSLALAGAACSGRTHGNTIGGGSTGDGGPLEGGSEPGAGGGGPGAGGAGGAAAEPTARLPTYASDGSLERPDDWERWVFLGATLDISYSTSPPSGHLFANVFLEPTAFDHFVETGEFREGTQTVLALYAGAMGEPPAVQGSYQGALTGFEMSVKDSSRHPDTVWAYYGFGNERTARALPPASCFSCHDEHAATDHVFTQFYPVLRDRR